MSGEDWSVAVFKCNSEKAKDMLVDLYDFARDLEGVRDLHFLIRDGTQHEVVFSFRFLELEKDEKVVNSKIAVKLRSLVGEDGFAIDPNPDHPLHKYVAWNWRDIVSKCGSEKFSKFYGFLSQMSKVVVDMARNNYFDSGERVELAHAMSWMLGCTEYGLLNPKEMQVGYYDRIEDKYHAYLREAFEQ